MRRARETGDDGESEGEGDDPGAGEGQVECEGDDESGEDVGARAPDEDGEEARRHRHAGGGAQDVPVVDSVGQVQGCGSSVGGGCGVVVGGGGAGSEVEPSASRAREEVVSAAWAADAEVAGVRTCAGAVGMASQREGDAHGCRGDGAGGQHSRSPVEGTEGLEYEDWKDNEQMLWLQKGTARAVWLKVKKRFTGEGGHHRYLQVLAMLMVLGEVEGGVGEAPAQWWTKGKARCLRAGVSQAQQPHEEVRAALPEREWGETVRVVVDWMSCTQSLRRAVPADMMYIGFDWQEWVYSGLQQEWVQNEVADLISLEPWDLWQKVQEVVWKRVGRRVAVEVVLLAMSPCCRTFSKADSSNVSRGHNYRNHDHPERPPKDSTSKKGKEAAKADRMVKQAKKTANWFKAKLGARFYMENPVGSLEKRPYMVKWEQVEKQVVKHQVDYCFRPLVQEAYSSVAQQGQEVDTEWHHRHRKVPVQVQLGDEEQEGVLRAHLQDRPGEPAGEDGQGEEGQEEHDAPAAAAGTGEVGTVDHSKDTVASMVRSRRSQREIWQHRQRRHRRLCLPPQHPPGYLGPPIGVLLILALSLHSLVP